MKCYDGKSHVQNIIYSNTLKVFNGDNILNYYCINDTIISVLVICLNTFNATVV